MTLRMVPIDEVLPGSVLGDNVHDAGGRVLLRAGTLLGGSLIESLRRRDVAVLPVEALEFLDPARQEALRAEAERRLADAFRMAGNSLASRILRQATIEFMLESRR